MKNLGTRFLKCDFQVHTPRDENYNGADCIEEKDRKEYSKKFIEKCRKLNLQVVAITDHHDLFFYKYIKEASLLETYADEIPIPEEDKIFVFPGMELTLDVPCQAIVIFDSTLDLTDDLIIQIYAVLGITNYTTRALSKTAPTDRLPIKDINDVYLKLETIPNLVGRFILFPNVKDGGSSTIIRTGLHNQYRKGRFIAGYLDGNIFDSQAKKAGWSNVINGLVEAYGNRSIGIFQTSDCRHEDFSTLGNAYSWIKISEPTAEGIRQACLAKDSRIKQKEPILPFVYIEKLEVINSSFLQNLSLNFNPQLNVIIGGRGTGKSSLLQYIEFALGKDLDKENSLLRNFIKSTLLEGSVILTVNKNGVPHIITRDHQKFTIAIGQQPPSDITIENISAIIQSDSYAQKELSKHGRNRPKLVNHLIEFSIQDEIQEINRQLTEKRNQINELSSKLLTLISDRADLKALLNQETSLVAQIKELQDSIKGEKDDKKTVENNSIILKEKAWINDVDSDFKEMTEDIKIFIESHQFEININNENGSNFINLFEINKITDFINAQFNEVKVRLLDLKSYLDKEKLDEHINVLKTKHSEHDIKYNEAKERLSEKQHVLKNIEENEKKLGSIKISIGALKEKVDKNKNLELLLGRLFFERISIIQKKYTLVKNEAENLSVSKEGCLEIELLNSININDLIEKFNSKVTLARGQKERTIIFFEKLQDSNKNNLNKAVLKFWYCLFLAKIDSELMLDEVLEKHKIDVCELSQNDLTRIISSLSIADIIDFSLQEPTFNMKMWYYKDVDNRIELENASDGQQAGAILNILLNQTHGPLLIDQPEDDIDNKVIHQITKRINSTKENRQLIFVSHNANIAVNGDAELIIQFDHNATKSTGEIKQMGAIDSQEIKFAIKNIMEGGEDALKLRFDKYGF